MIHMYMYTYVAATPFVPFRGPSTRPRARRPLGGSCPVYYMI